jgi:predicted AlkP superfamily pyrophosphatase or phosphodiesterase
MSKKALVIIPALFTVLALAGHLKKDPPPPGVTLTPAQPKLVIGIVCDQMRFDYVYRYWDKLGNDGFKRMLSQGYECRNTNYNYVPTFTGPGHASIYTGTTPAVHGIIANDWYDREIGKSVYCAQDDNVKGVGSESEEGKRSPVRLLSTTVGAQLHLASNHGSKVFGLALKDRSAIMPAGPTANGAYWYDGNSGNFITSTYYMKELPAWVNEFNNRKLPEQYLSAPWTTLLPIDQYTESLADVSPYEGLWKGEAQPVFPHNVPALKDQNGKLGMIRSLPAGNSFTRDFAEALITAENLGKGKYTDFLAVSFSSPDYIGHMFGPQSIEVEDCYLRLDQELAAFLKFIDNWVGKNNALVFLTADHGAVENPQFLIDAGIPGGFFHEDMVEDSLKKNVKRVYGDSLVMGIANDQVYLNRRKMDAKGIKHEELQRYVADFLLRFDGVASTLTATDLAANEYTETPKHLVQKGFYFRRSGDVAIILNPGWLSDWHRPTGTSHGTPWSYDTHVPLYWWGWRVQNGKSETPVNITDIAPTLCMMLNIQTPNGCTGKPISGITK